MASLTQEELLQVYETARTTDIEILKKTAVQLFPERFSDELPKIYLIKGGTRGFSHGDRCSPPKFTIGTPPLQQIGIMEDGTAYPY